MSDQIPTGWIVRRWARFGHNRLYAATPGGTDLGYLDLATGRFHSDDISNLPLLRAAIADHLGEPPHPQPQPQPQPQSQSQSQPLAPASLAPGAGAAPGPGRPPSPTRPSSPGPNPPPTVSPGDVPAIPRIGGAADWVDLADVRAGAAARERALAEREAQGRLRHLFARLVDAKTEERAWRIGAEGEEAIAAQLAAAGVQWRVLHAVRVGSRGADIDHVVIGPGGVFTVNAKNHPKSSVWVGGDTVMVNGRRVPYVRNSRHEARRASRMLAEHVGFPVPVTGLIAVVGARRGFTIKRQPEDGAVVVVGRRGLSRFLRSQPARLGLREIDAIHEVARRSDTWQR